MEKESYELRIKKAGIQSLNIEELKEYKKNLQEKAEKIRKNLRANKILSVAFGTMGVVSNAAVATIAFDYFNKNMPKTAAIGLGIPFTTLAAVAFAGFGVALQEIENEKKNRTNSDEEINLLEEETFRRIK